jgi:hypothetical protein
MSGSGEVYASKKAANLRKMHTDAARGAAAAREVGRRVFVYATDRVVVPEVNSALNLLIPGAGEDEGTAAIVEGVESQGWQLEHVVFSNRLHMFFRRLG